MEIPSRYCFNTHTHTHTHTHTICHPLQTTVAHMGLSDPIQWLNIEWQIVKPFHPEFYLSII